MFMVMQLWQKNCGDHLHLWVIWLGRTHNFMLYVCCVEGSAANEAESEEMPVGSPLADHEFVSDSFQSGSINAEELKKEMDQLGVSDKMQDSSGTYLVFSCNFTLLKPIFSYCELYLHCF